MAFGGDPRAIATIIGSTAIVSVIMYVLVNNIMTNQNVSGGMWDLYPLIISLIPVALTITWVFATR